MRTVRTAARLRAAIALWRAAGETVAFVPTMGALHAGHLALHAAARAAAQRTIVSIFVNPLQFGPGEDLARYPRPEAADAALLAGAGCDLLFAPTVKAMYPPGFSTSVHVAGLSDTLEGAHRPGHFAGVATAVARLLTLVAPDDLWLGEKDWQQLAVVRRMVADLALPVAVRAHPVVREPDGLALSSRNAYLTSQERARAPALHAALAAAAAAGATPAALAAARAEVTAAGFTIDYLTLADPDTLAPRAHGPGRLLVAARLGTTRLLDTMPVAVGPH